MGAAVPRAAVSRTAVVRMRARRGAVPALALALAIALGGCTGGAAPDATATATTPTATTSPGATSAPPAAGGSTPEPTGPPASLVVGEEGCTQAFLDEVSFGTGGTFEAGFLRPEFVDGVDLACSGTQQTPEEQEIRAHSFAIVPNDPGAYAAIDERIRSTGLRRDDPLASFYVDEADAAWAFLQPVIAWEAAAAERSEDVTGFEDAEAWLLVQWFEPR
jgi:hypothetical protein